MPANRDMPWFKLYGKDHINGTTRAELDPAERSVWVDLLALASVSHLKGVVALGDGVPYPRKTLADVLKVPLGVLNSAIKKMVHHKKIRVENGVIFIINWHKYQTWSDATANYPSQRGSRGVGEDLGGLLVEKLGEKIVALTSVSSFLGNKINKKTLEVYEKQDAVWMYQMCFNGSPGRLTMGVLVRLIAKHGKGKVNCAMVAAANKPWRFGMVEEILERRIIGQGSRGEKEGGKKVDGDISIECGNCHKQAKKRMDVGDVEVFECTCGWKGDLRDKKLLKSGMPGEYERRGA